MELSEKAKSLYRVQDYAGAPEVEGLVRVDLRRFNDDGGSMIELLRPAARPLPGLEGFRLAQINYSCLQSGVVKAFHLHQRQTDVWFVPPEDRVLLVVADLRAGSSTEGNRVRMMLGDGVPALVRIPPGVAHGCRNLGREPARMIYFTDLEFSPAPGECDEGRLAWDFLGSEVWEVAWE